MWFFRSKIVIIIRLLIALCVLKSVANLKSLIYLYRIQVANLHCKLSMQCIDNQATEVEYRNIGIQCIHAAISHKNADKSPCHANLLCILIQVVSNKYYLFYKNYIYQLLQPIQIGYIYNLYIQHNNNVVVNIIMPNI